jgi:hypothetical protein
MTTDKPKNLLLPVAGLVGRGFLLGVGVSIALGFAVLIGREVSSHQVAEQTETMQFGGKALDEDIAIIGTATNHGKKAGESL